MTEHEYALLNGVNRSRVGKIIGTLAAVVSALLVFLVLRAIDLAKSFGWNASLTPSVMSLIGAAVVFSALYAIFDRYAWKSRRLNALIRVPNLSGKWICTGETLAVNGTVEQQWNGIITIFQSWDKIKVSLQTSESSSSSISAALNFDETDGYRLLYHFRNDPKVGKPDLAPHHGFAEILFDKDVAYGSGEYFNGRGRFTFGRLTLERDDAN